MNVAGIGVLKSAEQGDNAQTFIDFLLETPAAGVLRAGRRRVPARGRRQRRTPRCRRSQDIQAPDVDLADLADLQGTLELLQETGAV